MPVKKEKPLFVANTTGFVMGGDGEEYRIVRGQTLVAGDHPARKAAPLYFDPAEDRALGSIEQMTAAPGEQRGA